MDIGLSVIGYLDLQKGGNNSYLPPVQFDLKLMGDFIDFAYLIPYINPDFCSLGLFALGAHLCVYVDLQGCG